MNSTYDTTVTIIAQINETTFNTLLSTSNESLSIEDNTTSWSTIAAIVYYSLNVALILALSLYIHITEEHKDKKAFLYAVWCRRAIYGQILVHLYDTATDIGVLIEWGELAYDTNDYKSIDMRVMFYTSIAFMIAYRFFNTVAACFASSSDGSNPLIDAGLALCDFYIIKTVYESIKGLHEEPTPRQKVIQLLEAIFESLPQVCPMCIFYL